MKARTNKTVSFRLKIKHAFALITTETVFNEKRGVALHPFSHLFRYLNYHSALSLTSRRNGGLMLNKLVPTSPVN